MDVRPRDSFLDRSCLLALNCSDDSLDLILGAWEALSVRFGPNFIAVDKYLEITSNAGVLDFPDVPSSLSGIKGVLQLLFQLSGLLPVASSATVLDVDVQFWVKRFSISPGQSAAPHRLSESVSGLRSEPSGGNCQTPGCDN